MSDRSELRPMLTAIAIFAVLSIAAAVKSQGFLEADACTHFLQAKFAFQQPHYFVNIWGRPMFTMLYALPASLGGRTGARLMSLVLAIGCGLVAWRIAINSKYRWPALALIFTLAQPLVFLHSFSEMTELPFALLIGLAFLAYQARQWLVMAILIGLSPLSRPEGFGFLFLGAAALLIHRRWWWIFILPIPLILWDLAGWELSGQPGAWWRWLMDNWPYAAESLYDHGSPFRYVFIWPAIVSPIIFPGTLIGIWRSLLPLPAGEGGGEGAPKGQSISDSPRPLILTFSQGEKGQEMLVAVIPLLIFVGHSVLYALGKMASNGEIRYMLIVAPFWGLLSAKGWAWFFGRFDFRAVYRAAGVAALLPILANFYYPCIPLKLEPDDLDARRVAKWYQQSSYAKDFPRIATAHQMVHYFLGTIGTHPTRALDWRQDTLASPPGGTIAIWDPIYSVFNSDARRKVPVEELLKSGWIDISEKVPDVPSMWHVLLSPKDAGGRAVPNSPSNP